MEIKQLLIAIVEENPQLGLGTFDLCSEEECGNSVKEQVEMFFGVENVNTLEPGQYLYSYGVEYKGDGWSYDAMLSDSWDDTKIYLYRI